MRLRGTARLIRLALRQDRLLLPAWVLAIAALTWGVLESYQDIAPTAADRIAAATLAAGNPLARVFDGPASGTDLGAMALVEGWKVLAVLTALMAAQTVVRHSRREEECGRAELVGSTVVGRHARLAAALVVAGGASLATGVAVTLALAAAGGLPWAGSLAAGGATAGMGLVFAAVAAVGAQVLSTARGASGLASGVLAASFALRAVGDVMGEVDPSGVVVVSGWPSWLSPYGWGQQVRPFQEDRWWVLGLFLALAVVLAGAAAVLDGRRDVGAGMVAPAPGPVRAGRGLRSAFGLAWRLQRAVLMFWLVGLAVFGAAFGSIGDEVADYVDDNDAIRAMLETLAPGADVVELYVVLVTALLGLATGGYAVQALLRMRAEEVSGRLEPLLATATGRARWLASHTVIAAGGATGALLLAGAAGGMAFGAASGQWRVGLQDFVAAAAVQLPAVAALAGFVLVVFAALPRWAGPITWFALAAALVMGQLGGLFELPQWLLDLSPFSHVPPVPAEPLDAVPLLWLGGAALAMGVAAVALFRRRDLVIGA